MQRTKKLGLTAAALTCRSLGWFPLWLLVLHLAGSSALLPVGCIQFSGAFLSAAAARGIRLHFRSSHRFLAAVVQTAAAILCCLLTFYITGMLFPSVVMTAGTIIGANFRIDAEPDQLFTVNTYTTFLTAAVLVPATLYLAHLPTGIPVLLPVTGAVSALYFLLRNQFTLHRFINRRTAADTAVPPEIRRGNLMLLCAVFVMITCIIIFRAPLLHLMTQMKEAAYHLAAFLWHLISQIAAYFEDETTYSELPDTAQESELLPAGKGSPLWLLLWIPVIPVAVIIWREFLSDWVYDFRILLARLIAGLRNREQTETVRMLDSNDDYFDTETAETRGLSLRRQHRTWRKEVSRWKKLPDSPEKFYAGYRLLLRAPHWNSEQPQASDTVREIREKWAAQFTPAEALDAVTNDFHTDRYAAQGLPQNAVRDIAEALEQMY